VAVAHEWFLEGKEAGLEEGLVKGREEGERAALAATLSKLICLRFRAVPRGCAARIDAASKVDLERWLERVLTAESLNDLFA